MPPDWVYELVSNGAPVAVADQTGAAFLAFDLAPGTYAVVCFIPNMEPGMPHVMLGAVEVITVA